jgi:cytochrome c-type biogenesis protein
MKMAGLNSVEGISSLLNQYPAFAISLAIGLGVASTSICPFSIPASLGIVGYASSANAESSGTTAKKTSRSIASFFFAGIIASFFLLGLVASSIGQFLIQWENKFSLIAAVISFFTGLTMLLRFRLPGLKLNPSPSLEATPPRAFGFGVIYSATIVTTSTGPLLLLLAAAAVLQSHFYGVLLTVGYGIGRGLPFLLLGTYANKIKTWSVRLKKFNRPAEVLIGIGLVVLAFLMAKHGIDSSRA